MKKTFIAKKIASKVASVLVCAVMAASVITFTGTTQASAASNVTLPLPTNGSYKVTVFSKYSNGVSHDSYIGQYILKTGAKSIPNSVMDIAASRGTPIRAVADGVIYQNNNHSAGGYNVVIKHNDGTYSYYGHMLNRSPLAKGKSVKCGDVIGYVGMSGAATGYHLHFEWSGHDPYCEFVKQGYNLSVKTNSGASAYPHNHGPYTACVKNTDGELMINSGMSSKNPIGSIPEGAMCTVYPAKSSSSWYYVNYNGKTGYAFGKYLSFVKNGEANNNTYTAYVYNTNGSLAINATASSKYMIGKIPEGKACTVYANKRVGNWVWVSYNGVSGYAYSKYLRT